MTNTTEVFALFLAGLSFFFIGISGLKTHLQQLTSHKFRSLLSRWTKSRAMAAGWGFAFGAITQSSTAVAFILSSLVAAGMLPLVIALPILGWANLGTTVLVFVAAVDLKVAVLYLVGLSGLVVSFNITNRNKAIFQVLLNIGLLFFGLRTMRESFDHLAAFEWFPILTSFMQSSELAAFAAGALLRLGIQSSSAIVVLAITLASSGMITESQGIMMTFGTGLGVAGSSILLSVNLMGIPKQIILFQAIINGTASVLMLGLAQLRSGEGGDRIADWIIHLNGDLGTHLAVAFLCLQILCALMGIIAAPSATGILAKFSPPTSEDDTESPKYIHEGALEDPDTALDLLEQEQQRFAGFIPGLLTTGGNEAGTGIDQKRSDPNQVFKSLQTLSREIESFLPEIVAAGISAQSTEKLILVERRQRLLANLCETLYQFDVNANRSEATPRIGELASQLTESLDAVLRVSLDGVKSGDSDEIEMSLLMTADKGEMMKSIRTSFVDSESPIEPSDRQVLFHVTTLFERSVWLLNQYVQTHVQTSPTLEGAVPA
jgi:phosphate:Na+ symporter